MELCNYEDIRQLLSRHGFHFSKSMGQNFLIAEWVPQEMVARAGISSQDGVLEIGPGIGPLTQQLALCAGHVTAVELDRSLLPILEETMAPHNNVNIICADIIKAEISTLVHENLRGFTPKVCANLPYNITTPVLTALLEAKCFSSITVMIQREVARRICAAPGTADYGAFSVYCQYHADPELLFDVGPECFLPPPKVTSSVITLRTRSAPPVRVRDEAFFFRVVKAAFAQRRKTLLNALSAVFGGPDGKERIRRAIADCGLPEAVRGERLGIPEFSALADLLNPFRSEQS